MFHLDRANGCFNLTRYRRVAAATVTKRPSQTHHREVSQHLPINPSFVELVLVLRESDVIEPTCGTEMSRFECGGNVRMKRVSVCGAFSARTCGPDVAELRRLLRPPTAERLDGQLELLPVERVLHRQLLETPGTRGRNFFFSNPVPEARR